MSLASPRPSDISHPVAGLAIGMGGAEQQLAKLALGEGARAGKRLRQLRRVAAAELLPLRRVVAEPPPHAATTSPASQPGARPRHLPRRQVDPVEGEVRLGGVPLTDADPDLTMADGYLVRPTKDSYLAMIATVMSTIDSYGFIAATTIGMPQPPPGSGGIGSLRALLDRIDDISSGLIKAAVFGADDTARAKVPA